MKVPIFYVAYDTETGKFDIEHYLPDFTTADYEDKFRVMQTDHSHAYYKSKKGHDIHEITVHTKFMELKRYDD